MEEIKAYEISAEGKILRVGEKVVHHSKRAARKVASTDTGRVAPCSENGHEKPIENGLTVRVVTQAPSRAEERLRKDPVDGNVISNLQEGKRFDQTPVSPQGVLDDTKTHLTTAIAMLD